MARFTYDQADSFGGNGGHGFFSLKNDGDIAKVRFLYDSLEDVTGVAVHQVEVDGKKRYVNCLREYGRPVDDCPFCKSGSFVNAKLFIPVYDVDSQQVKIWERGKKFFGKMSSLCQRYAASEPLCSHTFEIERHGKPGDTATTYEIYECGKDSSVLADLPEVPEIIGGVVLDKSADEMRYYLDYGSFPDLTSEPRRREPVQSDEPVMRRRTPVNREDTF